ncbi:LapA family protein [Microbacterium sp. GXF6406]
MADSSKPSSDSGEKSAARNGRIIVAILIAIAALSFVFSNVTHLTLRFLFMQFTMPAWAWFLTILLAGVVIGSLFPWFRPKKK